MNSAQDLWNSCVTDINEIYLRDASFHLSQHPQLRQQALEAIDGGANSFEVVSLGANSRTSWWQLALWSKDVDMLEVGVRHQSSDALTQPLTEMPFQTSLMQWIMENTDFSQKEHRAWISVLADTLPACLNNPQAALWVAQSHHNERTSVLMGKLAPMAQQGWNMSLALDDIKPSYPAEREKLQELIAQRQLHHLSQAVTAENSPSRPKKI